ESPAPAAEHPAEQPRPKGRIQYVGPDTYILLDAEGRPQPVPGMTYEDFLAAWKKLNQTGTPDSKPRFTIESIKFNGQSHDQRAELKFEATIRLLTDSPVDVPLGLVGAILQGEARFGKLDDSGKKTADDDTSRNKASKSEYLDFNPQQGGFVARMAGKTGERQTVSF